MQRAYNRTIVKALSIAAPAFNEAEGLEGVVLEWIAFLASCTQLEKFEIVVCNDGSSDDTGAILTRLAARDARIRPVHHRENVGAAAALATAIRHTCYEWILLIDTDGQFPIENLPRLIGAIEHGADAVLGRREKKDSLFARFGSWVSGILCNLFHGVWLRDFNSAFKLVNGPTLRSLPLEAKGLNYSTEITSRLLEERIKLVEVPIDHRPRAVGKSSRSLFRDAVHRFCFVIYIGMRQLLLRLGVIRRTSVWRESKGQT